MEIRRSYQRFREFGGWRLIRAYWRMGAGGMFLVEMGKWLLGRSNRDRFYSRMLSRVTPVLHSRYYAQMLQAKTFYDARDLPRERSPKVWFCWLQGLDDAPEIVKACLHSQQALLRDREVVVLSEANYADYVNLPAFFVEKYKAGLVPRALFSDVLRLELLTRYGGTWMDATVLVTSTNYPPRVLDCDLFLFRYPQHRRAAGMSVSNWFITSCTNNTLLLALRDMLYQYWHDFDCTVDYYIFHQFFAWLSQAFPDDVAAIPRGSSEVAIELGRRLERGDRYDATWMQDHLARCCFHKLSCRMSPRLMADPDSYYLPIISLANSL